MTRGSFSTSPAGPRQRAPVIEHMDAVGEVGDHLHIMLDPDHGNAELMLDAQDEAGEVLALLAVEAGRRLVEQQDRGLEASARAKPTIFWVPNGRPPTARVAIALELDEFDDLLDRLALARFPRAAREGRNSISASGLC